MVSTTTIGSHVNRRPSILASCGHRRHSPPAKNNASLSCSTVAAQGVRNRESIKTNRFDSIRYRNITRPEFTIGLTEVQSEPNSYTVKEKLKQTNLVPTQPNKSGSKSAKAAVCIVFRKFQWQKFSLTSLNEAGLTWDWQNILESPNCKLDSYLERTWLWVTVTI